MRKIIPAPTDIPAPNVTNVKKTEEFNVELITPMYGGGATAGCNDSDFPIRPTSIRGQLRFWWRATRGAECETSEELFKKEKEIWGSTDEPSSTIVKIDSQSWNKSRNYVEKKPNNYGFDRFNSDPVAYVLFSATANKHNLVAEELQFRLSVSYEADFEQDVLCAVWAWVNFGGIGARTRRGCGALYCKELAPEKPENFRDWFEQKIKLYELELGVAREWPTLSRKILAGAAVTKTLDAWSNAVKPMKNFRQGVGIGRNEGSRAPNRPGRSRWPEPDTLRRALNTHNIDHAPAPIDQMPNGFPRAAFGLPIIFEFRGSFNDPPKSELSGQNENAKRMGSPVILRPLKTKNEQNVPLVTLLQSSLPTGLVLSGRTLPLVDNIVDPAFSRYPNSPIGARSTNGNAIEAFFAYLKESPNNFKEVGR